MARRPRCPVCRSRRWHRDALSGSIVCDEGHLLQGYVHETTETQDGPSQHTQHTRRLRKNRAKRERPPANAHFHGARDRFLVWQALQLVLREQLRVLIDDLGWPVELEPAARDLWALLVASSDVPPNPLDHARGDEPPGSYAGPRLGDRYTRAGRTPYGKRGVGNKAAGKSRAEAGDDDGDENADGADAQNGDGAGAETTTAGETSADDGDDDDDDDESDADSYFSEADEADDERPRAGGPSRRNSPSAPASPAPGDAAASGTGQPQFNLFNPPKRRPMRAPRAPVVDDPRLQPRLEFTLLIVYLASMTLRLPVFLSDIFRLAESYQIMYLDAASRLPAEMQEHLSKRSRDLLSPSYVPHLYTLSADLELLRAESVQAWLARLVSLYRDDWGVEFPEANVPLLLGRTCGLLALPPLAYTLTAHLLSLLPGPPSFHLPPSLTSRHPAAVQEPGKAPWPSVGKRLEGAQDWRTALPEVKVATLVVVVCRMLWRLDEDAAGENGGEGESSTPPLLTEYAPYLAQRDDWLDAVEAIAALERPGDLQLLWSRDVVEMTGDEVDAYLDFCEAKIVNQDKLPRRMADISRFFPPPASDPSPLAPPSASSYLASLSHLTSSLHPFPSCRPPTATPSPSPVPAALPSIRPTTSLAPLPSRSHSLASSLPTPLHRLLTALASHLAPAPAAVHHKLAGAYPRDDERGAAGLAKLVEQVEWALEAAGPRTRGRSRAPVPTPAVDADVDDDAEPDEAPPPPKTRLDALRAEAEQRAVERRAKELEAKRASEQAYNRDRFYSDEDESSGLGRRGNAEEGRMRRPRGVPTASRAGDVYWIAPSSATALAADALSSVAGTSDAGATGEDGEVEEWGRFKSSRFIEDSDDEAA